MAKNSIVKRSKEVEEDFDFSDMMDSPEDEAMIDVMQGMLEASNNHMSLALELTKLVLQKNAATAMREEEVFSVYKKSLGIISESFPLKALWEKFQSHE
jgi:hypothetical protein